MNDFTHEPRSPMYRLVPALSYVAIAASAFITSVSAQDTPFINSVVRINVGSKQGSGVCLQSDAKHSRIYFATCYHVLQHTKKNQKIILFDPDIGELVVSPKIIDMSVDRASDICVFCIKLDANHVWLGQNGPNPIFADTANIDSRLHGEKHRPHRTDGVAVGFPYLRKDKVLEVPVGIWGTALANELGFFKRRTTLSWAQKRAAKFGFLSNEITMSGMSGGGVFTSDGKFAGLVFGRIPDTQGLMIPVEAIKQHFLSLAKEPQFGNVNSFAKLKSEIPFEADVGTQLNSNEFLSSMTWSSFASWALAFEDGFKIRDAFDRFQEVRVDWFGLSQEPESVQGMKLFAGAEEVALTSNNQLKKLGYTLTRNGRSWQPDAKGIWPIDGKAKTTLIVIRKSSRSGGSFVNGLFGNFNEINLKMIPVGKSNAMQPLHVVRSLPGVFKGYSVFVTLENRDIPPKHHEAELLLSLNQLLDAASSVGLTEIPIDIKASRHGSYLKAKLEFSELNKSRVERISPQLLSAEIPLTIKIIDGVIREFGPAVRLPPTSLSLKLRGVVQLIPTETKIPGVVLRATSAYSESELPIKLFEIGSDKNASPLSIDLANVFAQAAAAFLNKHHFDPGDSNEAIAKLFQIQDSANFQQNFIIPQVQQIDFATNPESKEVFVRLGFGKQTDKPPVSQANKLVQINGPFYVSRTEDPKEGNPVKTRFRFERVDLDHLSLAVKKASFKYQKNAGFQLACTGSLFIENANFYRKVGKKSKLTCRIREAKNGFEIKTARGEKDTTRLTLAGGSHVTLISQRGTDGKIEIPPFEYPREVEEELKDALSRWLGETIGNLNR